jgi:uncharacterized protein (TIGR02246 family)
MQDEAAVARLYEAMITGWNEHDGDAFAAPFAADGAVIGFDGSKIDGRDAVASEMTRIFADHETAPYVAKVKSVLLLSPEVALLRAVVGMIPPGKAELEPSRNAHQTVVAVKRAGEWSILLLQNTPAQFHGRPELVERMTQELCESIPET